MANKKISDLASGSAPAGTELLEVDQSSTSVSLTATQIANTANALNTSVLTAGTLGATRGGTGISNPTAHSVLVAEGSSAFTPITVGTNGQLLIGQTSADPAFTTVSGDVTINNSGVTTIGSGKVTNTMLADQDLIDIGNISRSRGDLITGGASAWQRTGVGTSAQFLGTDGTDPIWRNAARVVSLDSGGTYTLNGSALTVATHTLPGGLVASGDLLTLEIAYQYLNNSGAGRTPTFEVDFGATAVFTEAVASQAASASARNLFTRTTFIVVTAGNPSSVATSTMLMIGSAGGAGTSATVPTAATGQIMLNAVSATDRTDNNVTIKVTVNGVSDANHKITTLASVLTHTPKW